MKRILLALWLVVRMSCVAWSYQAGGIMNVLLDPKIESATRLMQIQDCFRTWGPAAPGAYLLVVRCAALPARWTDLWLANWRDGVSGRECSRRGYCLPDHANHRQTENRTVSRTPNTAEVSDRDRGPGVFGLSWYSASTLSHRRTWSHTRRG